MNGPQRFRKRPVEVEAMQWTGDNAAAMRAFTGVHKTESGGEHLVFTTQSGYGELFVAANGAWLPLEIGEWVLHDTRGFYPCKPDIFAETYGPDTKPLTAAVEVRVIAEGQPYDGPVIGTVNVVAPPRDVDEARAVISRALPGGRVVS